MARADLVKVFEELVLLSEFGKVGNSSERKVDVRIDQFLSAGDLRQIHNGVDNGIEAADVRDH